jgi:hypothetical protein
MILDLIAYQRRRTGRDGLFDQRHREVRYADMPGHAEFPDMCKRAQRLLQRNAGIGPVQQQQIDVPQAQRCQALLGGSLKIVRRKMRGPHLGGHEHLLAIDPGGTQSVAYLAFVLVDLGGVDMAIA